MPMDHSRLLEVVTTIARSRNVTVTVKQSAKAGVIAGGSCFFGAVVGGPVGLVLGGLVGTSLAYMNSGNIRPLWQIVSEDLSETERSQLVTNLQLAFQDVGVQDVAILAALIMQNSNFQETAMRVAVEYVTSQCITK